MRTLVVPLSGVDELMPLQVGGVGEHQVTLVTLVGLLLGMGPGMGSQITNVSKLLT